MKTRCIRWSCISLCLIITFLSVQIVFAQQQNSQHVLQVGDKAPELKPYKWIKGMPFDEFKKDHIYLIEFGATWCTPCAAAIPELNELALQYKGKLTVMSVFVMEANDHKNDDNPAYVAKVEAYIKKRNEKMNYAISVDGPKKELENSWLKAADKTGIPYMFVIDGHGNIASIASNLELTRTVVKQLVTYGSIAPTTQVVVPANPYAYDPNKLLLINNNGGKQDAFYFRSVLTPYDGLIRGGNSSYIENYLWDIPDTAYTHLRDKVQLIDVSIAELYHYAYKDTLSNAPAMRNNENIYIDTLKITRQKKSYGKEWHLPVLEVQDQSPFLIDKNLLANRFNYSLKVPEGMGRARFLQQCMRRDLDNYFGYKASVEVRTMSYWKVAVSDPKLIKKQFIPKSKSVPYEEIADGDKYLIKNAEMRDVIWLLGGFYGFPPNEYGKQLLSDQLAYVDETGIKENFYLRFDKTWSFNQFREYLNSIGLAITKEQKPMRVVVIKE